MTGPTWIDKDLGKVTPSDEQIQAAANAYLETVITNPDSPPLDRSLSSNVSAAPADIAGGIKRNTDSILPEGISAAAGIRVAAFEKGYYESTPETGSTSSRQTSSTYMCAKLSATTNDYVELSGEGGQSTQRLFAVLDADSKVLVRKAANASGKFVVDMSDYPTAAYVVVNSKQSYEGKTYLLVGKTVDDRISAGLAEKQDKYISRPLSWSETFGTESYPDGWQTGYYSKGSGATSASSNDIRTPRSYFFEAKLGDDRIIFTATGYHLQVNEYKEDGTYVGYYGDHEDGSDSVTVNLTEGYKYNFSIGGFDGDAGDYIDDEEFLATVTATLYKSFESWQKEQDERLAALEKGEAPEIPDYYFEDDYLQGRADEITRIQRLIGNYTTTEIVDGQETEVNHVDPATDAFWFITDYHFQHNEGKSIALIKWLKRRTGITKLFFAGDSGGSAGSSETAVYHRLQKSAEAWEDMASTVEDFYGTLGNHEWLVASVTNWSCMMGSFLNRFKNKAGAYEPNEGAYWFDNVGNKIRYFFLNCKAQQYCTNEQLGWFANQLLAVPADYSIAVVTHFAYIPSTATVDEYNGRTISYSYPQVKRISELLAACRDKTDITFNEQTYNFSGLQGTRHIIGVFSGHIHHGVLYTESQTTGVENIAVFRGGSDACYSSDAQTTGIGDDHPWYWKDGIVTGQAEDQVERMPGTITEQCFYAVQIDMHNKKLYITAIGGDHDWSGYYEPPET